MEKILILGGNGFLGSSLVSQLNKSMTVISGIRSTSKKIKDQNIVILDYLDQDTLFHNINMIRPDLIVNCIGIASVDRCEQYPDVASNVMINNLKLLCDVINSISVPLIHISTDQIFSKPTKHVFSESDKTSPCNYYGELKLAAEQVVFRAHEQAVVLRTNFFGLSKSNVSSSAEILLSELQCFGVYKGFYDVWFTPVHTSIIGEIIKNYKKLEYNEIYNISCNEVLSKYDFAKLLSAKFGFDVNCIIPISVDSFHFKAKRSKNMALSNKKIKTLLPSVDFSLNHSINSYFNERLVLS
jgi:dTDP-4-dehydrorhamnose reductase